MAVRFWTSARLARVLLATAIAAGAAWAQVPATDAPPAQPGSAKCGSVVVVKCEPRNDVESANAAAERTLKEERARRTETRRADGNTRPDLGRVIIEGERIKPMTVEESIQRATAGEATLPAGGTHTYSIGEGAQCTCMNVCPPWWTLMPCCSCTDRSGSRLATSPGSTPLR